VTALSTDGDAIVDCWIFEPLPSTDSAFRLDRKVAGPREAPSHRTSVISSCRSGLHSARRHRGDEAHVFGLTSERDASLRRRVERRGDVLRGERRRGNPGVEQRLLIHPRRGGTPPARTRVSRPRRERTASAPFEGLNVREVLEASGRPLVSYEFRPPDERQLVRPASGCFVPGPCFVPRHAADGAHDVNLDGFHAHLDDSRGLDDLLRAEVRGRKPERGQRLEHARGVLGRGLDEDVDVAGVAGAPWYARA